MTHALRSAFDPGRAAGVKLRVAVTLGQERFEARVHEGRLAIQRGECPEADAGMFAAAEVVAALALGRRSLAESLEAGEIRIEGHRTNDLPPWQRETPMVWQSLALFPFLTVLENVEFGLKMRKVPAAERRRRVDCPPAPPW